MIDFVNRANHNLSSVNTFKLDLSELFSFGKGLEEKDYSNESRTD